MMQERMHAGNAYASLLVMRPDAAGGWCDGT